MNKITIEYIRIGSDKIITKNIPIKEYFDPLNEDEVLEITSSPIHAQPYLYITSNKADLVFLNLKILFGKDCIEFKQTFWNDGDNMVTERIESGFRTYHELIISSKIDKKGNTDEIIRLVFKDEKIFPVYHGFIKENKDGSDNEKQINLNAILDHYKAHKQDL
ncbi:MAG: hypothetical protein IT222_01520 [Crocinitomix sp.]|nr:hypothetical protein [Crocinitomix sp.]